MKPLKDNAVRDLDNIVVLISYCNTPADTNTKKPVNHWMGLKPILYGEMYRESAAP